MIYLLRVFLKLLYVFPVKRNRILFSSFNGKNFNCNPKYIFTSLYNNYDVTYDYIWCLTDPSPIASTFKGVKIVKNLSPSHIFYLMTAQIIISNQPIEPFLPKRKNQLFINTSHGGGAYKKGGIQAANLSRSLRYCMTKMKYIRSSMIDYVISSCKVYTEIFSTEIEYHVDISRFLPIGLPRIDILFNNDHSVIRRKICSQYNIDESYFLILYAPTYRGHYNHVDDVNLEIDTNALINAVEIRFGKKAKLLFRHHVIAPDMNVEGLDVIDVSNYQDMQELLAVSDMFMTDYSSCLWDFSFTYRPGFLYVPDLKEYESETAFHTSIEMWPFPYAQTMETLCSQIKSYDENRAIAKIKKHHQLMGSFEHGNATTQICNMIVEKWTKR